MSKKKSLFITFEGIEGSGKSYQSLKLYKNLLKKKFSVLLTREPGGTKGAEKIRRIILDDYFHRNLKEKFNKYTDTLLYLAARNEHVINKIKPALLKKKIVICDRFVDSTTAYQVYGKKIEENLINTIHKYILNKMEPDLTLVLKANISTAMGRIKKRKTKNRYDKFSKNFYLNVQKAFIKIANKNKKRYIVLDNSENTSKTEKIILKKFLNVYNNEKRYDKR